MFQRVIEKTTRKEYGVFWKQFAGLMRGLGKGSQEAAISLEEAPAALEGVEQKQPLSSVVSCICRLTPRLWIQALPPSTREVVHLKGVKETCGINVQRMATFALDGVRNIKKMMTEGDNAFIVVCVVLFLMMCFNIVVMRQLMMLSRFLQMMDARIEKLDLNQAILLKLWSEKVSDGSCSS
jgi:hypothetical protein